MIGRLGRDRRGAALVEFAIVAPVMLLMIMGLGDILYQVYAQSILSGELQKAARDSGIEGGAANAATFDAKVVARLTPLMRNFNNDCGTGTTTGVVWCSTRKSYDTFSEVKPEPFVDTNNNGIRDPGECFTDVNGNGTWDADPGTTGQGGASAVTLYTIRVTYPRLFPVAGLLGWSTRQTISATTLLKNQPYATQNVIGNQTICT
ncbi:TadE/TadG family type IV pilus assembly protein [uncultured Sphingomonas sp.]|uniref:TadE/TadG family type IV pilus assembly protein n=1 Tax=uncultured Sphingomonas sp. TaxID=158754 RepID=UPI0035CAA7CA